MLKLLKLSQVDNQATQVDSQVDLFESSLRSICIFKPNLMVKKWSKKILTKSPQNRIRISSKKRKKKKTPNSANSIDRFIFIRIPMVEEFFTSNLPDGDAHLIVIIKSRKKAFKRLKALMESFFFVLFMPNIKNMEKKVFLSWFDAINENLWIFYFLERRKEKEEKWRKMRGLEDEWMDGMVLMEIVKNLLMV